MTDTTDEAAPRQTSTPAITLSALETDEDNLTLSLPAVREERTTLMKILTWALMVIALIALSWLGRALSDVLTPVLFAMFLCYLIVPLVGLFERIKLPRVIGYILSLAVIAGIGVGFGFMMAASVDQFSDNFPGYESNLRSFYSAVESGARFVGYLGADEELLIPDLIKAIPMDSLRDIVTGGVNTMMGWLTFMIITLFFMVFMIFEAENFYFRVETSYQRDVADRIINAVKQFNSSIQRYMMLKVAVSALTAGLSYVIMLYFGLDFAGLLAFILFAANFIPYIGSIVATILPGIVALLQFPAWQTSLIIMGGIVLVQQIMGNMVEPRLQGKGLNISPVLILIFLAYFSWMWGIVGMIISMPVAAGLRIIFEQFEATKPVARMMRNI